MRTGENCFLILGLDPSTTDLQAIETKIKQKQGEWNRDRSSTIASKQRKAEIYLEALDYINERMRDPEKRAEEARQAQALVQEERVAKKRKLAGAIKVIARKHGKCTEKSVQGLVKRFKGDFTREEIEAELRKNGVTIESAGAAGKRPRRKGIDKTKENNVTSNLRVVQQKNVYEFLELQPQSPASLLRDTANQLHRELLGKDREGLDHRARKSLCGFAIDQFKSEEGKTAYDNTLARQNMAMLHDEIETAGEDDRLIDLGEFDVLIRLARDLGVDAGHAAEYIEEFAAKRNPPWVVQSDAEPTAANLLSCGFCGQLADTQERERCLECGENLLLECHKCGQLTPSQDRACRSCGCITGDAPVVLNLAKRANDLLAAGKPREAFEKFNAALSHWPDWLPAQEGRERAQRQVSERENSIQAIEALVRDAKLFAARDALERLTRVHGKTGLTKLRARIQIGINKAEEAFRTASSARDTGDQHGAVRGCELALRHAADFSLAKEVLTAMPPPAPVGIRGSAVLGGFRLHWDRVESAGSIEYQVIRKKGSAPRSNEDGDIVTQLKMSQFDDVGIETGAAFHYAVFSVRGGVSSADAARLGPLMHVEEVKGLEARPGPGQITLGWEPPAGCTRVIVRRQSGQPPASANEGQSVNATRDSAHDTGLNNELTYGYRVAVVFDNPENPGEEIVTPGTVIRAVPVVPPNPVRDLTCTGGESEVTLNWTPIERAAVQIRVNTSPVTYNPGQTIAVDRVGEMGDLVESHTEGRAYFTLASQGRFQFVPLTVKKGLAVVGEPVTFTSVQDVTCLSAKAVGSSLVLTWEWPPGVPEVVVARRNDRAPSGHDDSNSIREAITDQQYRRSGRLELKHVEKKPCHIAVYAKASNADVYASGAHAFVSFGKGRTVHCKVVRKKSLLGGLKDVYLEMSSDNVDRLGGIVLVIGKSQMPISPTKGKQVAKMNEVRLHQGSARIPIPKEHWGAGKYCGVFFSDPAQLTDVRLRPARIDQMEVG